MISQEQVFEAIRGERLYQDSKWGTILQHPHTVAEWLLIMQSELNEGLAAWVGNEGEAQALLEILQVVSVGVACLEQHGVVNRAESSPGVEMVLISRDDLIQAVQVLEDLLAGRLQAAL